jgi:hypothetical protein
VLIDTRIRNSKSSDKPVKLTDAGGLYLEVRPRGSKLWRYRYRIAGKENVFALSKQLAGIGINSFAELAFEPASLEGVLAPEFRHLVVPKAFVLGDVRVGVASGLGNLVGQRGPGRWRKRSKTNPARGMMAA